MKYVSDIIGTDYKEWKLGQTIFISTPTGSGKTTFVLEKLVKYAALTNKKILYLVNRKILKEQLKKAYENIQNEMRIEHGINKIAPMYIATYQEIEKQPMTYDKEWFDYIIADECHYFLMDSMFNTKTQISLNWIMDNRFDNSIRIFMSATIERIEDFILDKYFSKKKIFADFEKIDLKEYLEKNEKCIIHYPSERNTEFLDVNIFGAVDELFENIKLSGKWLIFVDRKKDGNELEKELNKNGIDTLFIDAQYKEDADSVETVKNITEELMYKQKVLIATSVLDNGISIHDDFLKNIVVMTDSYEEMIQMIGRKRIAKKQSEKIQVYLCIRDENYFSRRLNWHEMCQNELNRNLSMWKKLSQKDNLYWSQNPEAYRKRMEFQIELIKRMWKNRTAYEQMRKFLYMRNDAILEFNSLSERQLSSRIDFYQGMKSKIKEDKYAFIREQCRWLGIQDVDVIIESYTLGVDGKYKPRVVAVLNKYMEKQGEEGLDKDKNIAMKIEFKKDLLCWLKIKNFENRNILKSIEQNERAISEKMFNKVMKFLKMDYYMEKNGGSRYIIKKLT